MDSGIKFDQNKDKKLWGKEVEMGRFDFFVGVFQYDGNLPKIQIKRLLCTETGGRYVKTGRFTKEECKLLLPVLQEALEFMENLKDGE